MGNGFLLKSFMGNTLQDYLIFLGVFMAGVIVVFVFIFAAGPRGGQLSFTIPILSTVLGWVSAFFGWVYSMGLPYYGVLRNPDLAITGPESFRPMLRSVVTMIFVFFVIKTYNCAR